jgi:hypothetical protein
MRPFLPERTELPLVLADHPRVELFAYGHCTVADLHDQWSTVGGRLEVIELRVLTLLGHELVVRANLHETGSIKDHDEIGTGILWVVDGRLRSYGRTGRNPKVRVAAPTESASCGFALSWAKAIRTEPCHQNRSQQSSQQETHQDGPIRTGPIEP